MSGSTSPRSPTPEAYRSPKRQRVLSPFDHTPDYSSPDELADPSTHEEPLHQPRRRSSRLDVPEPRRRSFRQFDGEVDSADELGGQNSAALYRRRRSRGGRSISPDGGASTARRGPTPEELTPPPPPPKRAPTVNYKPQLILRGHKRGVSQVKFSPDGLWIASCSADATIKIWDAVTGKHCQTLEGHLAGISTIAWSPDSKLIASGSDDKSIRFWDISTGKPHPTPLLGHHNYVYSVAFSPKGNILVSGSYDEAVMLWDVRSGRVMRSLPAHSDPVGGVDFIWDGTLVVSCASDGLIRIWDTATGQCLRTLVHEDNAPVTAARFSPNGRYVLAHTLDSTCRLWDYVDGRCLKTYQGHRNDRFSLGGAFGVYGGETTNGEAREGQESERRAFIATGSEDGRVVIWDVVSKRVLQDIEAAHDGVVLGLDTHPTKKLMVTCGDDRTIKVWRDVDAEEDAGKAVDGTDTDREEAMEKDVEGGPSALVDGDDDAMEGIE